MKSLLPQTGHGVLILHAIVIKTGLAVSGPWTSHDIMYPSATEHLNVVVEFTGTNTVPSTPAGSSGNTKSKNYSSLSVSILKNRGHACETRSHL